MFIKTVENPYVKPIYDYIAANKYISAITIFVLFFLLSKFALWITGKIFMRWAKKTKSDLDDQLIDYTRRPFSVFLIFVGARLALIPLKIEGISGYILGKLLSSFIAISLIYIVILIIKIVLDHWGEMFAKKTKSTVDDHLILVAKKFLTVIFLIAINTLSSIN